MSAHEQDLNEMIAVLNTRLEGRHIEATEQSRQIGDLKRALVEAEADRDRARDAAVALEQQLAEIKKITDQIESAAASDVRIRDERIEAAIERDGVWSSSRNPEIARASMAIDIQTGIVKRLRRALDGGER